MFCAATLNSECLACFGFADLLTSLCCSCCCRYTTQLVARLDEHRRVQGAGTGRSLFHALLYGVPMVDIAWLTDSLAQGQVLPVDPYTAKVRLQRG
jgi:hypothetical protein